MRRCAWDGHPLMAPHCQGVAAGFLRTAKGTLWPLCSACSDFFKRGSVKHIRQGTMAPSKLTKAQFDIPLDDVETLAAFEAQDPSIREDILEENRRIYLDIQRLKQEQG